MHSQAEALHLAELAGMAAYVRAFLGRAVLDCPEVVSLRLTATHQSAGLSVIEYELIDRTDMAVGGGRL